MWILRPWESHRVEMSDFAGDNSDAGNQRVIVALLDILLSGNHSTALSLQWICMLLWCFVNVCLSGLLHVSSVDLFTLFPGMLTGLNRCNQVHQPCAHYCAWVTDNCPTWCKGNRQKALNGCPNGQRKTPDWHTGSFTNSSIRPCLY